MSGERVVIERKTHAGVKVMLVDRGADDDEDNRWETICVDHGGVCFHETRWLATRFLSHPDEWCEDCQAKLLASTTAGQGRTRLFPLGCRHE